MTKLGKFIVIIITLVIGAFSGIAFRKLANKYILPDVSKSKKE